MVSSESAYISVTQLRDRYLILGLAGLIAASLFVLVANRSFVRPITSLAKASDRLANNDFDFHLPTHRKDELGVLTSSFDRMRSAVQNHRNDLLKEVQDRRAAEEGAVLAHDQALDASKAKSQFLATMSHEIRTPINGVLGMSELLLHTALSDKQRRLAEAARSSGESLLGIVNDILDFSKIEAGKLELQEVPFVRDLVEDLGQAFAQSAHAKGVELVCSIPADTHTALLPDTVRLRQILTNLVGNAIKFTEKGEVALRVTTERQENQIVRIDFAVSDTGIGIDEGAQKRIFDAFSQADGSTTTRYGGTGLGLAISQQLVELMDGELSLNSTPGQGSTFRFAINLLGRSVSPAQESIAEDRLRNSRILIVDDNVSNREIREDQLDAWNVDHDVACDAEEALRWLRQASTPGERPFDIALLDRQMPTMDGIDLAIAINAEPGIHPLDLVMLSSLDGDDGSRSPEANIRVTLTKPVRHFELRNCLLSLLTDKPSADVDAVRPSGPKSVAGFGARVLVAEDNLVNQQMARGCLELLGCESVLANDGLEALTQIEKNKFDAVLMDCRMPNMDGFAATAEIRNRENATQTAPVPIIALTANAMVGDRERCLNAGMNDYLTKPFTLEQLREVLVRSLPVGFHDSVVEISAPAAQTSPFVDARRSSSAGETSGQSVLDSRALDNIRALDRRSDKHVLERVIDLYLESSRELVDRLSHAVENGDASEIEDVCHTLKTASARVGASNLTAICKKLEQIARENQIPDSGLHVHELETEYERVCQALFREKVDAA